MDGSALLKSRPTVVTATEFPHSCGQPELTSGLALHSIVLSQRDGLRVRNVC